MRTFFLLVLLLPMHLVAGETLPAIALRVTHDSVEITRDGIERRQRFSENFVREGDNVWLERVIPEAIRLARRSDTAPGHEKEIEVMVVPRWITRGGNGAAALALVAADRKTLYEVSLSSHEALGFSGRWASSVAFIDPARVAAMPLAKRKDAPRGTHWHEKLMGETYVRVLWDDAKQYPRMIETGRLDGRQQARTVTTVLPLSSPPPWVEARGYTRRDYSDLGD